LRLGRNALITREQFEFTKSKYGLHASWAVWPDEGETPKSNMGDLSILERDETLSKLNPNVVLVALNVSLDGVVQKPFQNFHGKGGGAYKIRYALKDTPLWGAYMTDIIKDFPELESGKVGSYLRKNRLFEEENIERFRQELIDIGATDPTLIAFGNEVYDILERNLKDEFRFFKVLHYSHYISKEKYRERVLESLLSVPPS